MWSVAPIWILVPLLILGFGFGDGFEGEVRRECRCLCVKRGSGVPILILWALEKPRRDVEVVVWGCVGAFARMWKLILGLMLKRNCSMLAVG